MGGSSAIRDPQPAIMRIGITCYPTYGGSGAVATELGLELAKRGHDVHFISYASPFRLRGFTERVWFHEVVPTDYPLFEHLPYALALTVKQHEVAMRERLDLLHVHYAIPHATTAWLAKQMMKDERDLKVVTTLHGTDITLVGQDPSYFTLTKFSIEQSDRVTAVSEYLRDETYRAFGCVGCEVEVIPNFVSPETYYPAAEGGCRSSLAPKGHKVLLHVSNFRPVKRLVDVIHIFAGVRKELPATLVLVGDGPDRGIAEQEADRLGLRHDVRFLGKVENVADLLREGDLFVLPSQTESFGLAALEAMACGLPVVASRVGGLPEVVTDGESGALCVPGDVAGMTAHAIEILRQPDRLAAMRAAAIRRAGSFAADKVVPLYERLYADVLGS
jgi:N-acetyl-alpha-D-glucosaminyl L-malate synthase BshA